MGRSLYWIVTSPNLEVHHPYPNLLQLFLPGETWRLRSSAFWPHAPCYSTCKAVLWSSYSNYSLNPVTRTCKVRNAACEPLAQSHMSSWAAGVKLSLSTGVLTYLHLSRGHMATTTQPPLIWPTNLRLLYNWRILCHLPETQSIF